MIKKEDLIAPIVKHCDWVKDKLNHYKFWRETGLTVLAFSLWLLGLYAVFCSAPFGFPEGTIMRVHKNTSISQLSLSLYDKEMIRSPFVFKVLTSLFDSGKVFAGDYRFKDKENVFTLARRFTRGEFGINPTRVTILEGSSSREIATLLDKKLPVFEKDAFIALAEKQEGHLFPDTYFIKPSDDEGDIIKLMTDNFEKQLSKIKLDVLASNRSFDDILTMASIIELETRTPESRRMVSGILWNRIKKDMKLQVDAVFPYIMNKYSLQLTMKDLQTDSPYNTYKYKGLPPGPVGNPGLDSIKAALNPTKTSYLYYLSDKQGKMHYAETYKGHMANRRKYLGM